MPKREQNEISAESRADHALRKSELEVAREALAEIDQRLPTSKLHRIESRIHETAGELDKAIAAQREDLAASLRSEDPVRVAAAAVRLARLQESAGEANAGTKTLGDNAGLALLHGYLELRIELLLRQLNMAERRNVWKPKKRRPAQEFIRELGKCVKGSLRDNVVITRLLAAGLGDTEPNLIRRALETAGLGEAFGPVAVADLARSMQGSKVLDYYKFSSVEQVEHQFISMGGEAVSRILELYDWAMAERDEKILESIRRIYLWFDIPREAEQDAEAPEWMSELPLNWKRKELRDLARIMEQAYRGQSHLLRLADLSGIDPSVVNMSGSARHRITELLDQASRTAALPKLFEQVLNDPDSASFHDQIRKLLRRDSNEQ